MPSGLLFERSISGSDNVAITVEVTETEIFFCYFVPGGFGDAQNIFLALHTNREIGAAVLPFAQNAEGSTVFLPFKADLLLSVELRGGESRAFIRRWRSWRWSEREQTDALGITAASNELVLHLPRRLFGAATKLRVVLYAKD